MSKAGAQKMVKEAVEATAFVRGFSFQEKDPLQAFLPANVSHFFFDLEIDIRNRMLFAAGPFP